MDSSFSLWFKKVYRYDGSGTVAAWNNEWASNNQNNGAKSRVSNSTEPLVHKIIPSNMQSERDNRRDCLHRLAMYIKYMAVVSSETPMQHRILYP